MAAVFNGVFATEEQLGCGVRRSNVLNGRVLLRLTGGDKFCECHIVSKWRLSATFGWCNLSGGEGRATTSLIGTTMRFQGGTEARWREGTWHTIPHGSAHGEFCGQVQPAAMLIRHSIC